MAHRAERASIHIGLILSLLCDEHPMSILSTVGVACSSLACALALQSMRAGAHAAQMMGAHREDDAHFVHCVCLVSRRDVCCREEASQMTSWSECSGMATPPWTPTALTQR